MIKIVPAVEPVRVVRVADVPVGTLLRARFHKPDAKFVVAIRTTNGFFNPGLVQSFVWSADDLEKSILYDFELLGKFEFSPPAPEEI